MNATAIFRIRNGHMFDPECSRTTARLRRAWQIIELWGAERTVDHHPGSPCQIPQSQRVYGEYYDCCHQCVTVLSEWVTDECITAAWNAACTIQAEHGAHTQTQARK